MPILHMETEAVCATGQQINQASESLRQQAQHLHGRIQQLANEWQGPSSRIFEGQMQGILQRVTQMAEMGAQLCQRLQREVEEWERAASALSSGHLIGGMPPIARPLLPITPPRPPRIWPPIQPPWRPPWGPFPIDKIRPPWFPLPWPLPIMPLPIIGAIGLWPLPQIPPKVLPWIPKFPPSPQFPTRPPIPDIELRPPDPFPSWPEMPWPSVPDIYPEPSPLLPENPWPSRPAIPDVPTLPDIFYPSPLLFQGGVGINGASAPTAVSMALGYYNQQDASYVSTSPIQLIQQLGTGDGANQGLSLERLSGELHNMGYQNTQMVNGASMEELSSNLQEGPVLASVRLNSKTGEISPNGEMNHTIVITGQSTDGQQYSFNDPWQGNARTLKAELLVEAWAKSDHELMIIRP